MHYSLAFCYSFSYRQIEIIKTIDTHHSRRFSSFVLKLAFYRLLHPSRIICAGQHTCKPHVFCGVRWLQSTDMQVRSKMRFIDRWSRRNEYYNNNTIIIPSCAIHEQPIYMVSQTRIHGSLNEETSCPHRYERRPSNVRVDPKPGRSRLSNESTLFVGPEASRITIRIRSTSGLRI